MGLYIFSGYFKLLICCFFSSSPFNCGYSVNDVILLKSYIAVNCMYSPDEKHGPLMEYFLRNFKLVEAMLSWPSGCT